MINERLQHCDLVMKGGITSGVVYPGAIKALSEKYRFRSIGGASAGAIGAVVAAAAEYRRQVTNGDHAGFELIETIPKKIGPNLLSLFQPTDALRPLFNMLLTVQKGLAEKRSKLALTRGAVWSLLKSYWYLALGAGLLTVMSVVLALDMGDLWLGVLGLLVSILVLVVGLLWALFSLITRTLPKNDFGICSGKTAKGMGAPALTDWLADTIDKVAGFSPADRPERLLTIGDLKEHCIEIAAITTDISSKRPYQLPFKTKIHYFSEAEFKTLFSERLMEYLLKHGKPHHSKSPNAPGDLYQLPIGDDFPVFLVARMSLSFPGLMRTIPLYRYDDRFKGGDGKSKPHVLRRCLFSDGGISSNFPIHFFDELVPARPTFGISLGGWEEERHGNDKIVTPETSITSSNLPVNDVTSLGGFVMAMFNTAKDWQDTLQTMLPGYADRIVTVLLDDKTEGGFNLDMGPDKVTALSTRGAEAIGVLRNSFCIDQHRYDRALTLFVPLEESLCAFSKLYNGPSPKWGMPYRDVLTTFETRNNAGNSQDWRENGLADFADGLNKLGIRAADPLGGKQWVGKGSDLPSADRRVRLIATADRIPESYGA